MCKRLYGPIDAELAPYHSAMTSELLKLTQKGFRQTSAWAFFKHHHDQGTMLLRRAERDAPQVIAAIGRASSGRRDRDAEPVRDKRFHSFD